MMWDLILKLLLKKTQCCNQILIWMLNFKIIAFLIFKIKCMHARAFFILLFASIYNTGSSSVLVWTSKQARATATAKLQT